MIMPTVSTLIIAPCVLIQECGKEAHSFFSDLQLYDIVFHDDGDDDGSVWGPYVL